MKLKKKIRHADGEPDATTTIGKPSIWSDIVNNIGGWLNGTSNVIDSVKGNPQAPNTVVYQQGGANTGMYIGIAAAVVVVIVLVFAFKK